MLNKLITENYGIYVNELLLIDSHFGTEVFIAETEKGKFIVKTLPLYVKGVENEGFITNFLINQGISVAKLLRTNNGQYHVKTDEIQFHVQDYIEGKTLAVNTAPEWFIEKSAYVLGQIHNVLKNYENLDISFGKEFFTKSNVMKTKE